MKKRAPVEKAKPQTIIDPKTAPDDEHSLTPSYQNDLVHKSKQMPTDVVDEQSMESFPASDPPGRIGVSLPH